MQPMLAVPGTTVPVGPEWVHEVKWDGVRALVTVGEGGITVSSRRGNDVTVTYPELAQLAELLPAGTVLDGEIVAFDGGLPSFQTLARRMNIGAAAKALEAAQQIPVTLLVFDVLRVGSTDLCAQPWQSRRQILDGLGLDGSAWQTPPTYDDGPTLHEATKVQGLEGIVSKRRDSPYVVGTRSARWQKFPHRFQQSVVIGGWGPETDNPRRLGKVYVGVPHAEGLAYRGRVGSGLAGQAGEYLLSILRTIESADSPFLDEVPRDDCRGARWVEPLIVIDVEALGLSNAQRLRAPTYQRLRLDLIPDDAADPE